jgi:hypothetical protein
MYVVKYSGPFGFIKPWTAVRDNETFSQQFLRELKKSYFLNFYEKMLRVI